MAKSKTRTELEAEYWRLYRWRDRWIGLAKDRERMRRMGGLQSQMEYVLERVRRVDVKIMQVMRDIEASTKTTTQLPTVANTIETAVKPPLTGRWHHGNGVMVCGTIRIATEDFDTNPPQKFKHDMFDWMCLVLNEAAEKALANEPDMFADEERLYQ